MNERRPAESLLDEIADSALDDDYYLRRAGDRWSEHSANTVSVGIVLAIFATLVTMAALQSAQERPGRVLERSTMITDIEDGRADLKRSEGRVDDLEQQISALGVEDSSGVEGIDQLLVVAADSAARGPGITVTLRDAPKYRNKRSKISSNDLRLLVNELWYAGAEAIAIDDQRLNSLSSIVDDRGAVRVNGKPIRAKTILSVIGQGDALRSRMDSGTAGRYLAERSKADGLRLSVESSPSIEIAQPVRGADKVHRAKPIGAAK